MKSFDCMIPYCSQDWMITTSWLINRALFLITLMDRNPERFFGGDADTHEEYLENHKFSFYPEYQLIMNRYPEIFNHAFGIWIDDWEKNKISYVEDIENGNP